MSNIRVVSDWRDTLDPVLTAKGGWAKNSIHNLRLMLMHHPMLRGAFVYNEFTDQIEITRTLTGAGLNRNRPLDDNYVADLAAWCDAEGLAASMGSIQAQVCAVGAMNAYDPVKDWLRGLRWDGTKRLDGWLTRYAGAEDKIATRLIGSRFMVAAVARALRPGCKVDTMMVLEGDQGIRKSTMIRVLCGEDYYSDQLGDVKSKETKQLIQGYWCVEVAEMNHFSRAERNDVKDFLSKLEDRYRPPYGRNVITRKRRCVFIGTLNPDGNGYMNDPTGARRFWPVSCTQIDIDGIQRDREQLWAEAVCMLKAGHTWWIDKEEEAEIKAEQDARFDHDIWTNKITDWLVAAPRDFTTADVLKEAIEMSVKDQKQGDKLRVASVLKKAGYATRQARLAGEKVNAWFKVRAD